MLLIILLFVPVIFLIFVRALQLTWNNSVVDALTIAAPISFWDSFGLVIFLVLVGFCINVSSARGRSDS